MTSYLVISSEDNTQQDPIALVLKDFLDSKYKKNVSLMKSNSDKISSLTPIVVLIKNSKNVYPLFNINDTEGLENKLNNISKEPQSIKEDLIREEIVDIMKTNNDCLEVDSQKKVFSINNIILNCMLSEKTEANDYTEVFGLN